MKKRQKFQFRAFVKEYIVDFNGTRAAIAAGYSKTSARQQASKLLVKEKIQKLLKKEIKKRNKRVEVDQDRVIQELAMMAFSDIRDLYDEQGKLKPLQDLDDKTAATISSFKTTTENYFHGEGGDLKKQENIIDEYKRYDKVKLLELLGKHYGIFEKDNQQKQSNITMELNYGS